MMPKPPKNELTDFQIEVMKTLIEQNDDPINMLVEMRENIHQEKSTLKRKLAYMEGQISALQQLINFLSKTQ